MVDCTKCGKEFAQRGSLNRHLRNIHGFKKTFHCPHCHKHTTCKKGFVSHMIQIHNNAKEDVSRFIKFNNFIPLPQQKGDCKPECIKYDIEAANTLVQQGHEERARLFCKSYLGNNSENPHDIMNPQTNTKRTFFERARLLSEYYLGRVSAKGTLECPMIEARACADSGFLFKDPKRPGVKMFIFRDGLIWIKDPNIPKQYKHIKTTFR